jgi:type IX secretion system PorP/SprF family membrane protein
MNVSKSIALLFLLLLGSLCVHAQQPVFSQYYVAGLYLNPAQAGLQKDLTISSSYRSQWKSVDLPFKTFQVSCIYPIVRSGIRGKQMGGLALSFLSDVAGPNKEFVTQAVHATGAYNFQLNRKGNNILVMAMQGGLFQSTINVGDARWSQQFVDGTTDVYQNFATRTFYPVVNMGMAWRFERASYTKRMFGTFHGFSVSNLNKPDQSLFTASAAPVPLLIQANGGFIFSLTNEIDFCPTYVVKSQNHLLQTNTGAYASYRLLSGRSGGKDTKVILGAWYRMRDSFIVTTGLQTPHFAFGFSYDNNVSALSRYLGNAGAFEISATYVVKKKASSGRISSPLI